MRPRFLHLLFAALLFCAQAFALVHAVEHTADERDGTALHTCSVCLIAHDLAHTLTADVPALPVCTASHVQADFSATGRSSWPAPQPRQHAPPLQ